MWTRVTLLWNRRRLIAAFAGACMPPGIGAAPVAPLSPTPCFDAPALSAAVPLGTTPADVQGTVRAPERAAAPDACRLNALADEARGIERLHAIVVMHAGETLFAEALHGPPPTRAVNVKSVSKSLVAALLGCALERGVVDGVDATLGECIPELLPDGADPRVAALTLGELASMRAGLERTSGPGYSRWIVSRDWLRYALTRPFVDEPGGRMLYSTGNYHVLGIVLATLTGSSLHTLARRWLGDPLDIDFATWTRDPQGYHLGGNEMSLSPLDMARFGELYRRGGRWEGRTVLAEGWVRDSFTARSISPWSDDGYGYGWFLRAMGDTLAAYARGYGGQMIHVLPTEELVVVITSDTSLPARGDGYVERLHGLVETHLVKKA